MVAAAHHPGVRIEGYTHAERFHPESISAPDNGSSLTKEMGLIVPEPLVQASTRGGCNSHFHSKGPCEVK